jgi:ribosomal protein S18 acetylase RimI-like enzyme
MPASTRPLRPPRVAPSSRVLRIEPATELTDELVAAFARLIPQLTDRSRTPDREHLRRILETPGTTILVAREGEAIVGTLTLALVRIPTRLRAWIEDVVVDEAARGLGVGESLTREAIRLASEAGAKTVDLTSRPGRSAANRLYEKIGFHQRETNAYRYEVADSSGSL